MMFALVSKTLKSLRNNIKGVAKKFTQALCPIATFTLEISNFLSNFQKLYTISFLVSYHTLPYEIGIQIYVSFSAK